MPASSEFVALCRSQVALLAQALKASLSVVYLTEELVEEAEAKLIPIVAYPEASVVWETNPTLELLPDRTQAIDTLPKLLLGTSAANSAVARESGGDRKRYSPPLRFRKSPNSSQAQQTPKERENSLLQERQIVLPLIHEGVVMGLLVTSREDRPWNEPEIAQIKRIAHTLAIARILDRRAQWVESSLHQQQRLQAAQRDTLDNLLHQLRNPLTALRTFGKLLLRRLLPTDPNRDIATSIVRESDRVQEFLLQMDRAIDIEADELAITPAPLSVDWAPSAPSRQAIPLLPAYTLESCSVAEVLEPLLAIATAIGSDRQLLCRAEIPPDLPPVMANPKALREVLSNLIDNSLKYTPPGGQIYVKVGKSEKGLGTEESGISIFPNSQSIAIAISDTGPGIPAQDLQHLFERHYRGVQANTEIPGTGLGLAIARELVEQMQGKIQVFSPAERQWLPANAPNIFYSECGTTFILWLPVAQ